MILLGNTQALCPPHTTVLSLDRFGLDTGKDFLPSYGLRMSRLRLSQLFPALPFPEMQPLYGEAVASAFMSQLHSSLFSKSPPCIPPSCLSRPANIGAVVGRRCQD